MPSQPLIVYGDYSSVASPEVRLFHPDTGAQQLTVSLSAYGDMETAMQASIDTAYTGVYHFEVHQSGGSVPIGFGFAPLDSTTNVKHATATKDEAETALNNAVLDALDLMIENDSGWKFNSHAVSEVESGGGSGTAPTAAEVATAVWNRSLAGTHDTAGTAGAILQQMPTAVSEIGAVKTTVTAIAAVLDGITSLAGWLRLLMRSDAAVATDHATELNEINADGGSGGGDYDNTAHALEENASLSATARTIQISGDDQTVEDVLFVISGDDYYETDGAAFDFESDSWADLTGALSITFRAKLNGRTTGSSGFFNSSTSSATTDYAEVALTPITVGSGTQRIRLEMPSSASSLVAGRYHITIKAILANGHERTLLNATQGMEVQAVVEDEDP